MQDQVNALADEIVQLLTPGDAVPHSTERAGRALALSNCTVHVGRYFVNGRVAVVAVPADDMPTEPLLVRSALAIRIAEYMVRTNGAETACRDADGGFRTGRYDPVDPVA